MNRSNNYEKGYLNGPYLEVTSGIDEHVCWLEISVDHPRGVHVVQAAQDLVQEELEVRLLQVLSRVDDVVQVLEEKTRPRDIPTTTNAHDIKQLSDKFGV